MDALAWASEVLPPTHVWAVVFGWIALYALGRFLATG